MGHRLVIFYLSWNYFQKFYKGELALYKILIKSILNNFLALYKIETKLTFIFIKG